ncbi:MAG: hypothetical protein ABIG85_05775 [Chloroflexota bacterium]
MIAPRALAALVLVAGLLVAACGADGASPGSSGESPTASPATTPISSPTPVATTPTAPPVQTQTPGPTASATPTPTPVATTTPSATSTTPSPGEDTPTPGGFWGLVESGIGKAERLEVAIDGPNVGTLRYEADASATVIEGVVGFVCLGRRAYDGQSGFTAVPGSWTCGAAALIAGFRTIGQPLDAWNATLPSDDARRESVTVRGDTWTWSYRATSPYYGGRVTAVVTLDRRTLKVTAATREDPTGITTYTFHYGASFPAIAVPR